MYKLAPSLLSANFSVLGDQILMIEEAGAHYIHIDVMDGHFVPNISIGIPVIKSIRKLTNMTFDVHLMISEPERYLEGFAEAGADIINFHVETCRSTEHMLDIIDKIKKLNKRPAIAINPQTEVSRVFDVLDKVEMVLIMSVMPGFGGQELITDTLDKARELTRYIAIKNLPVQIEMDGGINLNNVIDVLDSGVNVIVSGSNVFDASDITGAVRGFYNAFRKYEESK